MKQKKKPFRLPAALEIVRCNEGGKEYIKEKKYTRGKDTRLLLIADFPMYTMDEREVSIMRRLAKQFARDYIRTAHELSAVVICNADMKSEGPSFQVYDKKEGGR